MKNLNNILSIFLFAIFVFLGFATEGDKLTEEQKAAYAKMKKERFENEIVGKKLHISGEGYYNCDDWIRFNADKSFTLVYTCTSGRSFEFIGSYDEESNKIYWKTNPDFQCSRGAPRNYFANEAELYESSPASFFIDIYANNLSGNEYYEHPFTKEKFNTFTKATVMFKILETGKCK